MHFTDELHVTFAQAVFLSREIKTREARGTPLELISKKICCRFETSFVSWDHYCLKMTGTEVGIKKGRETVVEHIRKRFRPVRKSRKIANSKFPQFNALPIEIKQMIVERVQCDLAAKERSDGRGLLNLRTVNKEFNFLANRTLERSRRCHKNKIHLAESYKSGCVRLGVPPFVSKITVPFGELDRILNMIALDGCKEIHIKCEFRADFCDTIMKHLLKHDHLAPHMLTVYGVAGNPALFHQFAEKKSSLQCLIFEKPLVGKNFFQKGFMPCVSKHFYNLGPQDSMPENVRNSFNTRIVFSREPAGQQESMNIIPSAVVPF